jgi:transposase
MTAPQVAELLGDSPRTVVNWVQRFESHGLAGLAEGERPGRPKRLSERQLSKVEAALRTSPSEFGLSTQMWDGPTLSEFIHRELKVKLKVRQCQRLFRQLGFRLRKPRPKVAQADAQLQAAHKKTPALGGKGRY